MRGSRIFILALALLTAGTVLWPLLGTSGRSTIWMTVWGMPFEDRLFRDQYVDRFESLHPGVHINLQRFHELPMKYSAWHARAKGPDVMRLRITDYHLMVERGMLRPLDAHIDDPQAGLTHEELDAFPPSLLESLRVDGHLYALPEDCAQYGLYYNRAIFDAYNASHPDNPLSYPSADWTWDDLRRAAQTLTQRDANGQTVLAGIDLVVWEWPFMHFFLQAGGEFWSEDGLTTLIDSQAGVDALEFLADLARDGSWTPQFVLAGTMGPDARFLSGRTAMYLDGSWMIPSFELRNPDLDFVVVNPPRGKANRAIAGSCLWGISAHARNPELGWEMVRWLVQEEQMRAYWDVLRVAPPAHLGVIGSPEFRSASGVPDPARPGQWLVPPMPESRFDDRAAWMLKALLPGEDGEPAPATVPASLYQSRLEIELRRTLMEHLERASTSGPEQARRRLRAVAGAMHREIDADRRARGLPPVDRR